MICVSTRGQAPAVPFRQAVVSGMAPDGGLYVPATIERRPAEWWAGLKQAPFQDVAVAMAQALLGDEFDEAELAALIRAALNFPIPIGQLDESLQVVELFRLGGGGESGIRSVQFTVLSRRHGCLTL